MTEKFASEFSPALLGGEVLVRLARAREDGVLTWNTAGTEAKLLFQAGRPEQAVFQGQIAATRQAVVGFVRGFAVLSSGGCDFEPGPVEVGGQLKIDTLGEVLVGMMTSLKPAQLEQIWSVRGGLEVNPAAAFDKLAGAVAKVGGPQLRKPLPGSAMATLAAGASTAAQRAWAVLLGLGALEVLNPEVLGGGVTQRPTTGRPPRSTKADAPGQKRGEARIDAAVATVRDEPAAEIQSKPPDDPEARRVYFEVERVQKEIIDKTHYDLLGVASDADEDAIKKAYFDKAREWHSDRFASLDLPEPTRAKIQEIFRATEEAYRTLSNKDDRSTYDWVLDRAARGLPTDPKVIMDAEGMFKKAQALIRKGEVGGAEPLLREAVALNHGEAEFWAYLGFAVYGKEGTSAVAEAQDHLRKALEMNEKLAVVYEFRGRIQRMEGNTDAALKDLKKCLEMNPRNVDAKREVRLLTMRQTAPPKSKLSDNPLGDLLGKVFKK